MLIEDPKIKLPTCCAITSQQVVASISDSIPSRGLSLDITICKANLPTFQQTIQKTNFKNLSHRAKQRTMFVLTVLRQVQFHCHCFKQPNLSNDTLSLVPLSWCPWLVRILWAAQGECLQWPKASATQIWCHHAMSLHDFRRHICLAPACQTERGCCFLEQFWAWLYWSMLINAPVLNHLESPSKNLLMTHQWFKLAACAAK